MRALNLLAICVPLLLGQARAAGDGNWPREIDTDSIHLVVYQPQVDNWEGNRIEARSAVMVTRNGDPAQIFGTIAIRARTEVDRYTRLVAFEDVTIREAMFPSAKALQPALLKAVRESLPSWPRTVSLDRLLASLAITQAEARAESARLKNDPPQIIFSTTPAALVLIDGEPVYRQVEGTSYQRVANTPALLLFDSAAGIFYLDGNDRWRSAPSLLGPWTIASNPPADLEPIKQEFAKDQPQESSEAAPAEIPPAVYVSTVPAELLVTRGQPVFAPLAQTALLYVSNSENDIFVDTRTQQYFTLLAGRWFRARTLEGPWDWVPGEQLPRDFAKIPPDSPKGHLLASIPGTEQAREAVIANRIPETATVRRSEAKLEVRYDGAPQFRPIEGTAMEYAINTSSEVVHAAGRYYAVEHGVWFVADSAVGPWIAADVVPAEIYTIPPSNPLYHLRYVYVYGATPEVVYVGYTPGYMGAFVSDGVVVFGTGWRYPGWCGDFWPFYCYGWPWTWGLGFQFSYWGDGWFWRPVHHAWWYHDGPIAHRVFSEHWNPRWNTPNRTWIRGNIDAYNHWGRDAVARRDFGTPAQRRPGITRPDVYAGRDGQVYQPRRDGWYRPDGAGQWRRTTPSPQIQNRLEQQRQSRSLGESRQREFGNRGQAPGIPRTTAPMPRTTAPQSRPSGPQPRAPSSPRGRGRG